MTDEPETQEARAHAGRARWQETHWGRLIGASVLVLAAAVALPRVAPAPDLQENRTLAAFPARPAGLAELTAYRRAMDDYVADHFPPRTHLIAGLNLLRYRLGSSGSPQVLIGRDGWLFHDDGSHLGQARRGPQVSDADAAAWLGGLAGRTEALAGRGKTYLVIVPPMKAAAVPEKAPAWFRLGVNRPAVLLPRLARVAGAGTALYLEPAMARPTAWGLKTYTPYDTHWTGLGAYYGYAALMQTLQAKGAVTEGPRPLESFVQVRGDDRNKPRNLALMLGIASFVPVDYPELGDPDTEELIRITWLTDRRDWTGSRVVDTGQAGKPVLLMTVDSFSNALLPFLYAHFSRIVIAHNDDGLWREDLIARFNPDIVVTEVVESGMMAAMQRSPAPSPEAAARIRVAVARRQRYALEDRTSPARASYRRIEGTETSERIVGDAGADDIQARPGDDTVSGGGGDDAIRGGRGADRIDGGDGDDWLSGDRGDDTLTGGRGADAFHGFADCGNDVVTDFSLDEDDRIELDPGTAFELKQEGADAVVEMQGGRLILKGVRASDIPKGSIRLRRPRLS